MKICPLCHRKLQGSIRDAWECPHYVEDLLFGGIRSHYRIDEEDSITIYIKDYRITQDNEYAALLEKPDDFHIYKLVHQEVEDHQYGSRRYELVMDIAPFEIKSEEQLLARLKTITNFS